MIKIIEGNIVSCACGCKFTYEKQDLLSVVLCPGYFFIHCPKCGEKIIFITEEKQEMQKITTLNEEN